MEISGETFNACFFMVFWGVFRYIMFKKISLLCFLGVLAMTE